jgi:hypothetical protein
MAGKRKLSISDYFSACWLGKCYANTALKLEFVTIGIIVVRVASCSLWSLLVLS